MFGLDEKIKEKENGETRTCGKKIYKLLLFGWGKGERKIVFFIYLLGSVKKWIN